MAGEMHRPKAKPSCFLDGQPSEASTLPPRQAWCWDAASACADAKDEDGRARQLVHTPGCLGCLRRLRAILIDQGKVVPHERRTGRAA